MDPSLIIDATRRWIAAVVIGLNLCPFAQRVFKGDKIRYVVCEAVDETGLLLALTHELELLVATPMNEIETTLLIHPDVLTNFRDYNEFIHTADQRIEALGLSGTIQIASFHPMYRFAKTAPDAVENYTNRSPYPMIHLLREDSISQLELDPAELSEIPRRNIATLRALGRREILKRLREIGPQTLQGSHLDIQPL
ncbi:MAG: DUF1415 domain-containing protein [Pedosphaera sp.]|nr:DUF1415 domain-containing protein [Pedosphaera sp.]